MDDKEIRRSKQRRRHFSEWMNAYDDCVFYFGELVFDVKFKCEIKLNGYIVDLLVRGVESDKLYHFDINDVELVRETQDSVHRVMKVFNKKGELQYCLYRARLMFF